MKRVVLLMVVAFSLMTVAAYGKELTVRAYIPGDKNPTIEVLPLDDPNNPYSGQYSELDEWAYQHFSRYISDESSSVNQMANEVVNQELQKRLEDAMLVTFRSTVRIDVATGKAFMVPILRQDARSRADAPPDTLGGVVLERQVDVGGPYFWSYGLMAPFSIFADYAEEATRLYAPQYPIVADWMIDQRHSQDLCMFLPDGGMVFATPTGSAEYKRDAHLYRYDASGAVVKEVTTRDYLNWKEVLLFDPVGGTGPRSPYFRTYEHFEPSGKLLGTSNNIINIGRYSTFRNDDRTGFIAVVDHWKGEVIVEGDLNNLPVDPYPYFNQIEYSALVEIYNAQHAATAGN